MEANFLIPCLQNLVTSNIKWDMDLQNMDKIKGILPQENHLIRNHELKSIQIVITILIMISTRSSKGITDK